MQNWKEYLKADPTEWLLEKDNPSVKYFALTEILDMPTDNPEVITAKKSIMTDGAVPMILSKMDSGGYWEAPASLYTAK
jgi:hypothetical protein